MSRRIVLCLLAFLLLCLRIPPPAWGAGASAAPLLPNGYDREFREGWDLLEHERFSEAGAAFSRIPPGSYDLGDYVLYFSGMAAARDKKRVEASDIMNRLEQQYPRSPLVPYLRHEIGYAAALDDDLVLVRAALSVSKGKVTGGGRKSEELYMAALLAQESGPTPEAARLHLENISAYSAQAAANLSFERLWGWWKEGRLASFDLPVGFYAKLGKAVGRTGEIDRAKAVYDNALDRFPASSEYYALVLDYAELLRKHGATSEASALLEKRFAGGLSAYRWDMQFLQARVDWKAGRLGEARKGFLAVASGDGSYATTEKGRYYAGWVALDEGDLAWATETFGQLRLASDEKIRQESVFRHAYGLYQQKRYGEAIAAFKAGERCGFGGVETARHRFWRARSLRESGNGKEADKELAGLVVDPVAGIYSLLAVKDQGGDPFRMFNASSSGETKRCRDDRARLWEKVLGATWEPADAEKVKRAARLTNLGVVNYAVLEAQRVDRGAVKKAIGLGDGGAAALFRYLAGDLRGGIRETVNLPLHPENPGMIDRIHYPLAPEYVSDCDRPQSGIDPLVLHSIIRQESHFQPDVISSAGAVGLMQLMPRTAAEVAKKDKLPKPSRADLTRPQVNVRLGASYLSTLLKEFDGDYFRAVAAYNGGEAAVRKWWDASGGKDPAAYLERISYQETRFYLRRVVFNLLQYYRIYRPEMFARFLPSAPIAETRLFGSEAIPPSADPAGGDPATPPTPEDARSGEPSPAGSGGM